MLLTCSSLDPFWREVARQAYPALIADGRIHPARIEESSRRSRPRWRSRSGKKEKRRPSTRASTICTPSASADRTAEVPYQLRSERPESLERSGVPRRHHGQGNRTERPRRRRAAFLHDIGKAIDRDLQGTHLELGLDFLRKHGESEPVLMAVAAHHMDIDWPSLEAMIVQAADAISAARPGARRDILESYVKRLEKLEGIADSFEGVSKSFALQAGREIRIVVESERISDEETVWLSKDIARRIENELEYPGQIKVTVIRETRAVEFAR